MSTIPYAKQSISDADIQAVIEVLKSDWLTQGPAIERFERAIADYCGVQYAVAVSSATSALHIACLAAGLNPGDMLWTSPNTFVASANCALYCGASVDFVDIDAQTYNMSPELLERKLRIAAECKTLPKVIIPVHFAGQSCEMNKISAMAREYGIKIIEDASHAIGGKYQGNPIGSCQYSDMTVFSFHPVKIITTGEGGMVVTNNKELYDKLVLYRSHGITRNPELMNEKSPGPWYYEQITLGYNYRLTDLQAALGLSQLGRVDEFIERRNYLASRYNERLSKLPVELPQVYAEAHSAFHLYVIRLRLDRLTKSHKQIFQELRNAGILVNLHYIPVHTQPYYQQLGFKSGDFPIAEKYYSEAISLPMYYGLEAEQQDYVIQVLTEVLV